MARIRSVHPDICTDETLVGATADAERMFVRLWTHLDDDGRCVDNPLLIKAALFPIARDITDLDVLGWIDELVALGCLRRYEVAGRRYLTAKPDRWGTWQKPRRKVDSKLPPPPIDAPCADNVGTRSDSDGQRPTGEVGVGGEGEGGESETEGESEGETEPAAPVARPVDNSGPLHDRLADLETNPPVFGGRSLSLVTDAPEAS